MLFLLLKNIYKRFKKINGNNLLGNAFYSFIYHKMYKYIIITSENTSTTGDFLLSIRLGW